MFYGISTLESYLKPNTVWLSLVTLFNGISAFMGYLTPKPYLEKSNSDNI